MKLNKQAIQLKPLGQTDWEIDCNIYSTGRSELLSIQNMDPILFNLIMRQQYESENKYLCNTFPNAQKFLIVYEAQVIGRIVINKIVREWQIISFVILTEWRNRGIGSFFLQQLIIDAQDDDAVVSLNVFKLNEDAVRLYTRIGFVITSQDEVSYNMIYSTNLYEKDWNNAIRN